MSEKQSSSSSSPDERPELIPQFLNLRLIGRRVTIQVIPRVEPKGDELNLSKMEKYAGKILGWFEDSKSIRIHLKGMDPIYIYKDTQYVEFFALSYVPQWDVSSL